VGAVVSNSLATVVSNTLYSPNSVNPSAAVNRESPRDFAILDGVGIRKRAILDVDLAGRDEQLGAAVNKKPQKTRDLNEKSRDVSLGFLCLPEQVSFDTVLKGSVISPWSWVFLRTSFQISKRKVQRADSKSASAVRHSVLRLVKNGLTISRNYRPTNASIELRFCRLCFGRLAQ